jgi:hypothetical protein
VRARLAWALCGLTFAVAIAAVVVAVADPNSAGPANASPTGPTVHDKPQTGQVPYAALTAFVFSGFALVGGVVAARRPRNPIGWLIGTGALMWMFAVLSSELVWHMAFGDPTPPAAVDYLAWFSAWAFLPSFVLLLSLTPLLFPTGAPPTPHWRVVGWTAAVAGGVATMSTALAPGGLDTADWPWIVNPFGVEGLGLRAIAGYSFVVVAGTVLASLVSLVVRYRRAHGIERLQLRWVAAAGGVLVLFAVGGDVLSGWLGEGAGWIGVLLGLLALAVGVGIAMLRYRLYDIDVVINRALVYAALTATLAVVYLGTVLLWQLVLSPSSDLAVAASTLAVAALFRPVRRRIQEAVDRRFFRRRYDARHMLERFGARLRDEVELDALSGELRAMVSDAMQPAHVSLWLRETR